MEAFYREEDKKAIHATFLRLRRETLASRVRRGSERRQISGKDLIYL